MRNNIFPHISHHVRQNIRSDMGFALVQDLFRSAVFHEDLQDMDIAPQRIMNQRVQLPVGECPCSALTELHVGMRVQDPSVPEFFHVLQPVLHRRASFQKNRAVTKPGKLVSAEQACRSRPDHHRTMSQRSCPAGSQCIFLLIRQKQNIGVLLPADVLFYLIFILYFYIYRIDIEELRFLPGVQGLFLPRVRQKRIFLDAKKLADLRP